MTDIWWRQGEPRCSEPLSPLEPTHPGYGELCLLCSLPLGGQRARSLPLMAIVVGLAVDDPEDTRRHHDAGLPYYAAAIVVHHRCGAPLTEEEVELFVASLIMRRHAPGPTSRAVGS